MIRGFAGKWRGIAPVKCFAVMPDHVHLLLKIEDTPDRLPLGTYVFNLERALARAFWEAMGGTGTALRNTDAVETPSPSGRAAPVPPVFEHNWHDWIVMKRGQLAAFARYILENPRRAWLRRENRQFFTRPGTLSFAGREWFSYGTPALLELPVLEPFRRSRSWAEGSHEWREALARAGRIGPGGAGVETFLSPCEKACGNAIFKAGGSFVVLAPEGFSEL